MVGRILVLFCAALLALPAVHAGKQDEGERSDAEKATREKSRTEKVYTTEDLERLYADKTAKPAPASQPAPKTPATGADPLKALQQRQTEKAERKKLVAESEQKLAAAEKRVRELEKRILAVKNPLLARPSIPEEERAEWNGQTAAQRVRSSEEKLRQAREELDRIKAELARLGSGN